MPEFTVASVEAAAMSWVGVRFLHEGRDRLQGVDCSGVIAGVATALWIPFQDESGYSRLADGAELVDKLDLQLESVDPNPYDPMNLTPPDELIGAGRVVAIWRRRPAIPTHLMILASRPDSDRYDVIHASDSVTHGNCVVRHGLTDNLKARICRAWRFPGVIEN